MLKKFLPDVLLVAGAAAVSYGACEIWLPLGYIVAGAFAIAAGVRLA